MTTASLTTLVNPWCTNDGVANSLTKKLAHGEIGAFVEEVKAKSAIASSDRLTAAT